MKCEILPAVIPKGTIAAARLELVGKSFKYDHYGKFLIPEAGFKNKTRISVDGKSYSIPGILAIQKKFIAIVRADALVRFDTDDVDQRMYIRSCTEQPKAQDRDIHRDEVDRYIAIVDQHEETDSGPIVFEGYDDEVEIYGQDTSWVVERDADRGCVPRESYENLSLTKLSGGQVLFIPKGALHGSDSSKEGQSRLVMQGDVYLGK